MENTIIISGRLGSQPETKDKGRGPWTHASIAYNQGHYDKAGQWVEADTPTAWFKIMANRKVGDVLATMNKGDTVMVVGRLAVDVWAPESGTGPAPVGTRTDLTIWASSVALVSRKAGQGSTPAQAATGYTPAAAPAPQQAYPSSSPWEAYNNPDF